MQIDIFEYLSEEQQNQITQKFFEKMLSAIETLDESRLHQMMVDMIAANSDSISEYLYDSNHLYNAAEELGKFVERAAKNLVNPQ